MSSNDPIKIRAFNPARDFDAYLALLQLQIGESNNVTEQEQRDYADMLAINLNTDRLVIDHPDKADKLVAVCDIWRINQNPSADLVLFVHPEYRRQGIGSKLLSAAIDRARAIRANAIDAYAQPEQKDTRAFLEHHGFRLVSHCTAMEMEFTKSFSKPNLPENHTIFTYADLEGSETDKLNLIVKAANEFWGVLWGHKVTLDLELAREVMKKNMLGSYSEDAMFFLYDGDIYVGHDRVHFSETPEGIRQGYGGVPGLHPDWYTPELAREFALVGLEWIYHKGCRRIAFTSWGDSEEMLRVFEGLGFSKSSLELGYQLPLSVGS